ncbi:DUF993 family protein [Actinacidiphila glaucinigra]|uniref:DUF993 family protein n=1 Tax=Actinacidiphila glaucinigra TaxID=235986 RepID=UPI00371590B4
MRFLPLFRSHDALSPPPSGPRSGALGRRPWAPLRRRRAGAGGRAVEGRTPHHRDRVRFVAPKSPARRAHGLRGEHRSAAVHRARPPVRPRRHPGRPRQEQLAVVEGAGSRAVLTASRALAAVAKGPEAYPEVCGHLLRQAAGPVVLLWLGPRWRSPTPRCGPGTGAEMPAETVARYRRHVF